MDRKLCGGCSFMFGLNNVFHRLLSTGVTPCTGCGTIGHRILYTPVGVHRILTHIRPRSPTGPPPGTRAPAGEKRRVTFVLEEDCPTCFEQDKAGHRMCLRCNCSCCNVCWSKMSRCPVCRFNKN